MIVTLDMPTSEIRFTDADTLHGAMKLNKALSFSIKRYSGMGPMTFQKVSLFENVNETGGHFRTGLWDRIKALGSLIGLPVEKVIDNRTMPRIQS